MEAAAVIPLSSFVESDLQHNLFREQFEQLREKAKCGKNKANDKLFIGISVQLPYSYNFLHSKVRPVPTEPVKLFSSWGGFRKNQVRIGFVCELNPLPIEWDEYALLARIPTALLLFERLVGIAEMQQLFGLGQIDSRQLLAALSTEDCNPRRNMGSLAIPGEVVLRNIIAIGGLARNPSEDETDMATYRDSLLNGNRLAKISKASGLVYFIQQRFSFAKTFLYFDEQFLPKNQLKQFVGFRKSVAGLTAVAGRLV